MEKLTIIGRFKSRFLYGAKHLFVERTYSYVLEEVNMARQEAVVRCSGTRTIMKFTLEALVGDMIIIQGMSPAHACLLGGCYGRILRAAMEGREVIKRVKKLDFLLSNRTGRYRIVFQNRRGEVGYIDKKSRQEFVEHPLTIVNNKHIISEFDSSEACYIGILAGSTVEKAIGSEKDANIVENLIQKPPRLRIVK